MKRGEIWWASLPPATGSGPGYRRPVLVIQTNAFNDSNISTVIVVVITSNLTLAQAPGNIRISKADSRLTRASVVNISQVLTIDREILTKRVSTLPGRTMERVSEGLRLVLGL